MSKTSKTVRYDMYINTIDTSGLAILLSKKEFQRQIKYYTGEIAKIHEEYKKEIEELKEENPKYWRYSDIEGCIDDMQIEKTDHEKYTETRYIITDGETTIVFRERTCKPGYMWK